MEAFLAVAIFKYEVFALASNQQIYRLYFKGLGVEIQPLGDTDAFNEFGTVRRLLHAQANLYQ